MGLTLSTPSLVLISFQKFCQDSSVVFEVSNEDVDILNMTCMVGDVIAWRKFRRILRKAPAAATEAEKKTINRKISCAF